MPAQGNSESPRLRWDGHRGNERPCAGERCIPPVWTHFPGFGQFRLDLKFLVQGDQPAEEIVDELRGVQITYQGWVQGLRWRCYQPQLLCVLRRQCRARCLRRSTAVPTAMSCTTRSSDDAAPQAPSKQAPPKQNTATSASTMIRTPRCFFSSIKLWHQSEPAVGSPEISFLSKPGLAGHCIGSWVFCQVARLLSALIGAARPHSWHDRGMSLCKRDRWGTKDRGRMTECKARKSHFERDGLDVGAAALCRHDLRETCRGRVSALPDIICPCEPRGRRKPTPSARERSRKPCQ